MYIDNQFKIEIMHDIWKYMVSSDVVGLADINTCNTFLRAQNKYPATRFTCHN